MLDLFRKHTLFKILEYFFSRTDEEIHLKELARRLKLSPRSVKIYCDDLEKRGILFCRKQGNMRIFSLNNDNLIVKEMKRLYIIILLKELGIDKISRNAISIAIYGSHATGEYDEKSDIDLLVIGDKKDVDRNLLVRISKKIGKEIQLTIFPLHKWESIREKDPFAKSILRKHVLISGAPL